MDDFAVARAGFRADQPVLFEDQNVLSSHCQRTRYGQANNARTDDDGLDIRRHELSPNFPNHGLERGRFMRHALVRRTELIHGSGLLCKSLLPREHKENIVAV